MLLILRFIFLAKSLSTSESTLQEGYVRLLIDSITYLSRSETETKTLSPTQLVWVSTGQEETDHKSISESVQNSLIKTGWVVPVTLLQTRQCNRLELQGVLHWKNVDIHHYLIIVEMLSNEVKAVEIGRVVLPRNN